MLIRHVEDFRFIYTQNFWCSCRGCREGGEILRYWFIGIYIYS